MVYEKILTEAGFQAIGTGCAVRKLDDLNMIAEPSESGFGLTVPCASPLVDYEREIDDYLKRQAKGTGLAVKFSNRVITFCSSGRTEETVGENLQTIKSILHKAQEQYELLPVCMCCGRVGQVTLRRYNGTIRTVCCLCDEMDKLQEKRMESQREMTVRMQQEWREHIRKEQPVSALTMVGLKAALAGCALGTLLMLLGNLLPMFHYTVFFPGALIGLYVADRIRKYSYIHAVSRYLIANVSAIVFAFCISSLTAFLNMKFQQFIGSPTAANFPALFGSMLLLNAFMGLPGLILAEILVGFSAAD